MWLCTVRVSFGVQVIIGNLLRCLILTFRVFSVFKGKATWSNLWWQCGAVGVEKKDIFVCSNHMVLKSLKISVALNIEGTIIFHRSPWKSISCTQKNMISQCYMFRKLNENTPWLILTVLTWRKASAPEQCVATAFVIWSRNQYTWPDFPVHHAYFANPSEVWMGAFPVSRRLSDGQKLVKMV